jgi:hypothetical protein
MDIKKDFEIIKKQYKLPEWNILDFEFEISSIEEPNFLIRKIRSKIAERVEMFCKILEDILQPDTCLSGLHECKFFNENQKKEIYSLYKKLMVIQRQTLHLSILNQDKDDAEFIIDIVNQWNEIKTSMSHWISQLKCNWEKETDVKEDVGYFG